MAIYGNMVVPSKPGGALPTDNSERRVYVPGTGVTARYSDQGGVLAGQARHQLIQAALQQDMRNSQAAQQQAGQQAKQAEYAAQAAGRELEGLQAIGRGIGALAPMAAALYERQQRFELAQAQEAFSRLQTEYVEKQREWSQIKGANAVNMEELKSRWWDEAMPRLTHGLSDYGRRYFNMHADRVGAMADTFIQSHQEQQLNQYEATQLKIAMDSEANMINLDPYNQQQTSASIGRIQALIHQDCVRKGLPPDVEQQMVRQAVGTALGNAVAIQVQQGNLGGAQTLFAQYQAFIPADQQAKIRDSYDSGVRQLGAAMAENGNFKGIEGLAKGSAGTGRLAKAPTYTGVARVMAYHESGTEGSLHVSYGLQATDGAADVGKYSFITGPAGGANGGSVGEFIRFCGRSNSPVGKRLYNEFNSLIGGDWKKLNNVELWKTKAATLWRSIASSDRKGFEELEDAFALRRVHSVMGKFSPDLQQAVKDDKTGALYEMCISTINQYGPGGKIIQNAWNATKGKGLDAFIEAVYAEKSKTSYFRKLKDPMIGARRARQEIKDIFGILHGGVPAQSGQAPQAGAQAPQMPAGGAGGLGPKPDTALHFQSVLAPQAMANSMWKELEGLPADKMDAEYARRMQALQKDNPVLAGRVDSLVRPMVKRQKDIYAAESEQRVGEWGVKVRGMDPLAVRDTLNKAVAAGQLTEEEGAKVYDRTVGGKRSPSTENREAALEIKRRIDRGARGEKGGITDRAQVEAAAVNGRLTDAQINDCLEYLDKGGQRSIVSVDRIEKTWKAWRESKGESVDSTDKIPPALVDFVYADMTPGKVPSTKELEASIAKGYIKGKVALFGSNYAFEAAAKGDADWEMRGMKAADWSRVDEWIYTRYPNIRRGQITDSMRKAAARQMMGMPWGQKNEALGGE